MSVLKNLRSLSEMQFYKTAIAIRKELTVWLLKDFGAKRNVKSVNQVIKDITEDEQKIIDGIFAKYRCIFPTGFYSGHYAMKY